MMDQVMQISLGALVALIIIKEVFSFLKARNGTGANGKKRPITGPRPSNSDLAAITDRLDRIMDRLDDLTEIAKSARKQTELNGEATARLQRSIVTLDETLNRIETNANRRQTGSFSTLGEQS